MSRTRRPFWELEALGTEGHRILLLYLQERSESKLAKCSKLCVCSFFIAASGFQGQLFFGSGQTLAASLVETIEGARRPGRRPVQDCLKTRKHRGFWRPLPPEFCILSFGKLS